MAPKKSSTQEPLLTYTGNCHCKAFVYEVRLPEIKSVTECNCSICHKKGYMWIKLSHGAKISMVGGDKNELSSYTFGKEELAHKFCSTCATPLMAEYVETGQQIINVRALQDLDVWSLEVELYDGAANGSQYCPPDNDMETPATIKGHELYTGSCHCGAVGLALMSKPLDDTYSSRIAECNCSVCIRNAYLWIYPSAKQVVLAASEPDNIGRYSFSHHVLNKTFCKICGVCMSNEYAHRSNEELKRLGAVPTRGFASSMKTQHPINLRVFHDLDFQKLPAPIRNNGAKKISPQYKNP